MPWALIDRVLVLLFDHHIFCVCVGDLENDIPQFHCDARLEMVGSKTPKLNIGQYMSGTGAFNSHALFELSPKGPMLIEITQGGRTGK